MTQLRIPVYPEIDEHSSTSLENVLSDVAVLITVRTVQASTVVGQGGPV